MDERKSDFTWWIPLLGVVMQVASVVLAFICVNQCINVDEVETFVYDRLANRLDPPPPYAQRCLVYLFIGFAGSAMCLVHTILSDKGAKLLKLLSYGLLLLCIFAGNAGIASMIYVNEGIPELSQYEVVESGEYEFLYAKAFDTVQVYFLKDDKAYRVDGFSASGFRRTYEAKKNEREFLEAYDIYVHEEDETYVELLYIK